MAFLMRAVSIASILIAMESSRYPTEMGIRGGAVCHSRAMSAGVRALFDFSEGYDVNPDQSYEVPLQNLSKFDQKVVRKAAEN